MLEKGKYRLVAIVEDRKGNKKGFMVWGYMTRSTYPFEVISREKFYDLLTNNRLQNVYVEKNVKAKKCNYEMKLIDADIKNILVIDEKGFYKKGKPYQIIGKTNDTYVVINPLSKRSFGVNYVIQGQVLVLSKRQVIDLSKKYSYLNATIVEGKTIRSNKNSFDTIDSTLLQKIVWNINQVVKEKGTDYNIELLATYILKEKIETKKIAKEDIILNIIKGKDGIYKYGDNIWKVYTNEEQIKTDLRKRLKIRLQQEGLAVLGGVANLQYYVNEEYFDEDMRNYYKAYVEKQISINSTRGYANKFVEDLEDIGIITFEVARNYSKLSAEEKNQYTEEFITTAITGYYDSVQWYIEEYGEIGFLDICRKEPKRLDIELCIEDMIDELIEDDIQIAIKLKYPKWQTIKYEYKGVSYIIVNLR